MQEVTFSDTTRTPLDREAGGVSRRGRFHGRASISFRVFVGPKDYDLLKQRRPQAGAVVNFGWMAILAKPLFLVVNWFNDNVVHNFGWAIVLVTSSSTWRCSR